MHLHFLFSSKSAARTYSLNRTDKSKGLALKNLILKSIFYQFYFLINAGCTLIACFVFVEKGCKGFLFNIDSSNYVNSRLGKAPVGGGGW